MTYLSLLLLFLIGFGILLLISTEFSIFEYIGISIPAGLFLITFGMFIMDSVFHIRLTSGSVIGLGIFEVAVLVIFIFFRGTWKKIPRSVEISWSWIWENNPITWVLLAATSYMVYAICAKAMYWPAFHIDAIDGYDFLARAIANEGTLANSLFTDTPRYISVRMTYAPLMPLGMAYFLLTGFGTAKIIQAVFLVSLIITLFGLLKRMTNTLSASAGVLFLAITPEFMAQSAMQMTNMPLTFFTCTSMLGIYAWYLGHGKKYFWLACIIVAFGTWSRSEMLVFTAGATLLVFHKFYLERKTKVLFSKTNFLMAASYLLPSFFVYLLWEWYLKAGLHASEYKLAFTLDQPDGKFNHMIDLVGQVTLSNVYYGNIIYVFIGLVTVTVVLHFMVKKLSSKPAIAIIVSLLTTWCMYVLLYYPMYAPGYFDIFITAGYKRGLFGFLPMIICLMVISPLPRLIFNWLQPKPSA